MGLSSSQARLLNLTSRMHQIEYKAAKIEAEKLQMANESRRVYQEYQNALEQTKIQIKTINSDASATYVDIHSYSDFFNAGYALYTYNSKINTNDGNKKFIGLDYKDQGGITAITNIVASFLEEGTISSALGTELTNTAVNVTMQGWNAITQEEKNEFISKLALSQIASFLGCTYDEINEVPFERLMTNLINSGEVGIQVKNEKTGFFLKFEDEKFSDYVTSVATNTGLQEVDDEKELRKAEAKYEADMRRIDMKDRKFDYDLAALDAERNAVKQEMETLKTVAKDNVDRTFKLFG